jgi:hypothetical protein
VTDAYVGEKTRWKPKFYHALIALALVLVAFFVLFRLSLRSEIQKKFDAIRAAGYPVTCTELDEWYSIPPNAENAAYYYGDAFSHFKEWSGERADDLPIIGRGELPARTEPFTEETKTLFAQYLADNRRALELLHEAAGIEHCRYPVDYGVGFGALFPHLAELRKSARLLRVEALLHAENGQPESAISSINTSLALGHSVSREPMLIPQLVRMACQSLAVSSLERVLNSSELADEQLLSLSRTVSEAEDLSAIARAFVGERCCAIAVFEAPAHQKLEIMDGDLPAAPVLELYEAIGLADADQSLYLDMMDDCIKASRLPMHQRQGTVEAAVEKIENLPKIRSLLRTFAPAFGRVTELDLRTIAHLRTAQVAVAVERYRLSAGRLPDALADLVPGYLDAVPTDPFDGKELRYKKLDTGFVVYSIGEDKTDNGGKEPPPKSRRRDCDVTFIIER